MPRTNVVLKGHLKKLIKVMSDGFRILCMRKKKLNTGLQVASRENIGLNIGAILTKYRANIGLEQGKIIGTI